MKHQFAFFVTCTLAFVGCSGQEPTTKLLLTTSSKSGNVTSGLDPTQTKKPIQLDEQISEYIREVFQDRDGVYWFGTNGDGVARYDGDSLTFLSVKEGLAGVAIRGILQAPTGDIWFATNSGVSRYTDGKFTNYTEANGLTDNQTWSIFQDSKKTIWVGTMGGVCRFDGKSFAPFPIPRAKVEKTANGFGPQVVWSMFEDRDGNIWFGTDGEGARKYDGKSFTIYTDKQGLAGNTVRSIVGDRNRRIWFGTRSGGVSCFDGTEFKNFSKADGLTNNEVYEIFEGTDGKLWFSTRGAGVCRFDGKTFERFGADEGLTMPHVQSIIEDRNGTFWFGCSGGLFRCDGTKFLNVKKNGPWPEKMTRPDEKKVSLDYASEIRPLLVKYCVDCHSPGEMAGLDFLADMTKAEVSGHRDLFAGVFEQMDSRSMPPKNCDQPTDQERKLITEWIQKSLDLKPIDFERIAPYVVATYEDRRGNLWFGSMQKGAARYDGERLIYFTMDDGLVANAVTSFAEDEDENLFVGTQSGVCKFDGKSFTGLGTAEGLPAPSRPSPMAWSGVSVDRTGNILAKVGTKVYRMEGTGFQEIKTPVVSENIKSFAIIPGGTSFQIEDKGGNLWYATDGDGAYMFDGASYSHFTKKDGLCSNNVTGIIEDKAGNIWFTCIQSYQPKMTGDGGLCRFDGKTFTQFPEVKGLSKNDIYTIYETKSGDIWIGATNVGAYRYDGKKFVLFDKTDKPYWTRNFGIQSITEDRNGTLWFGFSGGLFRFNGKSFYNVTSKGPWEGIAKCMANVVAGDKIDFRTIHPTTHVALAALANGKLARAKAVLEKLKRDDPNDPTIQEETVNLMGYHLIWDKELDLALEAFKLNTLLYPTRFNTFDSLAEAYWRTGNEQLAIENYKKSIELNATNTTAKNSIREIEARQKYEKVLVVPEGWLEEVLVTPPTFAPTMSIVGMEHLRLPPDFRKPDSDWFVSYLFAIELTEPSELNEAKIGEQLLTYFRGLAEGGSDQNGKKIDTTKFSIESKKLDDAKSDGEYVYLLNWQEPFVNGTPLKQNIRVKIISGKNKHGVIFVCGSPQRFGSKVWKKLLKIRRKFENSPPQRQ